MAPPGGGYPPGAQPAGAQPEGPRLGDAGGPIWSVTGGADRGGIVVRQSQELGSTPEPTRLSTGSLILELELVGERLYYLLMEGNGPTVGWVSTKLKDKELVVRTGQVLPSIEEEQAQAQAQAGGKQQQGKGKGKGKGGRGGPAVEAPQAQQWDHQSLFAEPEPAPRLKPNTHGVRWVPGSGTGGGKYAKLEAAELEETCQQREVEISRLESSKHAAELLDCLDKLERMRVPELKNEVKKRGMATPAGSKQEDLVLRLKDALLWERLKLSELQRVAKKKELPVAGDEAREDLLQMLAYSSWEARGVPIWRMPSDTVAHGIIEQLDKFEGKSLEELAQVCDKKNLPVEENLPSKEVLLGRLRTAIVWDQMPVPELRQECLDLGVTPEDLDEMGVKDEKPEGRGTQWTARPFGGGSPESMQREAMIQRLLEQMWLAYEDGIRISDYFQLLGLPETATVDDVKKSYKKLALMYHPDKAGEGEQELRTQDFQLISEAYESLLVYIKALQGEATAEEREEEDDADGDDRPQTAIFMSRHGERLDDAELAKGRLWVRSADRPWDPPLSERGRLQATAMGKAVKQHADKLGLPGVTRIFTSPFLRCVETAVEAARQLEIRNVCVEPSLCESFCESFFRAWCVPGANGDWGGPEGCGLGTEVAADRLKCEARGPASELLHPTFLKQAKGSAGRMNREYEPYLPLSELKFTWGDFETEEAYTARLRAFFDFVAGAFPGEGVIFVSHAGPLKSLFANLKPDLPQQMPGYCGLYLLHRPQTSGAVEWQAPLAADAEHMKRWARGGPGADGGGPFGRGSRRLPREGPGLY